MHRFWSWAWKTHTKEECHYLMKQQGLVSNISDMFCWHSDRQTCSKEYLWVQGIVNKRRSEKTLIYGWNHDLELVRMHCNGSALPFSGRPVSNSIVLWEESTEKAWTRLFCLREFKEKDTHTHSLDGILLYSLFSHVLSTVYFFLQLIYFSKVFQAK